MYPIRTIRKSSNSNLFGSLIFKMKQTLTINFFTMPTVVLQRWLTKMFKGKNGIRCTQNLCKYLQYSFSFPISYSAGIRGIIFRRVNISGLNECSNPEPGRPAKSSQVQSEAVTELNFNNFVSTSKSKHSSYICCSRTDV
jgi:hypothetical protein